MKRLLFLIIFTTSLITNKYLQATNDISLTNGSRENRFVVGDILIQLQKLLRETEQKNDHLPILSLIALCRHEKYSTANEVLPILQGYNLLDKQGRPPKSVKNVVESAIEIEPEEVAYRLITQNGTEPMRKWLEVIDDRDHTISLVSPTRKKTADK